MTATRRFSGFPQIDKASRNAPPLAKGSSGTGVGAIQDLLVDLGYPMPKSVTAKGADGIFGGETDAAVRGFQKDNGLSADGVIGKMTITALESWIQGNYVLETPCPIQDSGARQDDAVQPLSKRRTALI